MVANRLRIIATRIERSQHSGQALNRLFLKKRAGHTFDDRGQRAARAIRDDRAPGSLHLQGRYAKILLARKDKGAAVRNILQHLSVGEPTQKTNSRPGQRPEPLLVASPTDYHQ